MFWVHFILGLSVFTYVAGDCILPNLPKDGFFMTCGTITGSICQVYCRYNSKILMKKCLPSGIWSGDVYDCKDDEDEDDDDDDCDKALKAPADGSIVGVCSKTYGSVCVFKCNTGYNLVGSAQVYCLGKWTTSEPTCVKASTTNEPVKCPALNTPVNGYLDSKCYQGSAVGSVCYFLCSTGYTLVGSSSLICSANGQWSSLAPVCTASATTKPPNSQSLFPFSIPNTSAKPTTPNQKQSSSSCAAIKQVENGKLKGACQPGIVSNTCSVACNFGYYSKGLRSITCLNNGQWSGVLATCKRARYFIVQTVYW